MPPSPGVVDECWLRVANIPKHGAGKRLQWMKGVVVEKVDVRVVVILE
jgi:hypothetical protein